MWEFLPYTKIYSKTLTPYIKHPRLSNLCVLPYVRNRLVFAELLARAVEEESFDLLAVDLPHFLNDGEFLDVPLGIFPLASSLVIRRDRSKFALLPFVPNDAACLAAYFGRKKFAGFFECIDDNLMNYGEGHLFHPEIGLKDDYFVFDKGLNEYFAPYGERLELLLTRAAFLRQFCTRYRAFVVSKRLKECLSKGGKTLFVCEYQLWENIKKLLEDEEDRFQLSSQTLKAQDWDAAWVIEDPLLLWSKGLLDDYPSINFRFFTLLGEGRVRSFDKLGALNGVINEFVLRRQHPRIKGLINFMRYLKSRLILSSRLIPLPSEQLLDSARSCLTGDETLELARLLLEYPYPDLRQRSDEKPAFVKIGPDRMAPGGREFDLPDKSNSPPYWSSPPDEEPAPQSIFEEERRAWVDCLRPQVTKEEARRIEKAEDGMRWAIKSDYLLHERVCRDVLRSMKKGMKAYLTERSFGSIGQGVDWKANIVARAKKDKAIYIQRRISRESDAGNLDEFTPMVFIFLNEFGRSHYGAVHDSNISKRHMDLNDRSFPLDQHPKPDFVYSIFFATQETEYLWGHHIQREHLASIAFLYTRCSLMGVERYGAINKQPKRYQCRTDPVSDDELSAFSPEEISVAWAAKYAPQAVIVVAHRAWKPSEGLTKFVQAKNVKILRAPLSMLPSGMIQRLRKMHFISTALKKHPDRERIEERFVGAKTICPV